MSRSKSPSRGHSRSPSKGHSRSPSKGRSRSPSKRRSNSAKSEQKEYYKEFYGKYYTKDEWEKYKAGKEGRKQWRNDYRHKKQEAGQDYKQAKSQFEYAEQEFLQVYKQYFKKEEMSRNEMITLLHQWKQDLVNHSYDVSVDMNKRKVLLHRPLHDKKGKLTFGRAITLTRNKQKGRTATMDTLCDRFDEMFFELSRYINTYKEYKKYSRDLDRADFNNSKHRADIMSQLNRRVYTPKELKEKEKRKQQRAKLRAQKAIIREKNRRKLEAKQKQKKEQSEEYFYDNSSDV